MKSKKLLFTTLLALGSITTYLTLSSSSTASQGVMGASTIGCGSCHGSSASSATSINISGIPGTGWVAGTAYNLTLSINNMSKSKAGFDLSVSAGTISNAPSGTMLMGGTELHHTTPGQAISGTTTWAFTWTAPASGTSVNFNVAGNAVDNSGDESGDVWNKVILPFSVATSSAAPSITAVSSAAVTSSGATISGMVNANGATANVNVEYGTTVSYGSSVVTGPPSVSGTTATSVSATLSGLASNTTYHYRIRAINSVDTTYSTDMTFKTLVAASLSDIKQAQLDIYPNPATDYMIIKAKSAINQLGVQVYSLNGQVCKINIAQVSSKEFSVNTAQLVAGHYIMHITLEGKSYAYSFTKK
ncbi:MAG: T9SS type A sorting domain-containing protein [Chitinophagaceae bacterium]|nr:T9SS type A sorting domain-containing protein [Chitinophagaceae bacterium]